MARWVILAMAGTVASAVARLLTGGWPPAQPAVDALATGPSVSARRPSTNVDGGSASAFREPRDRAGSPSVQDGPCPEGMVLIGGRFCIDAYEASTVVILDNGSKRPHSPFLPVTGERVQAVSRDGVIPQAYISQVESEAACQQAGKRLCSDDEWIEACRGPEDTRYPYGNERRPGFCVDTDRTAPLPRVFGDAGIDFYRYGPMNDARLNRVPGTVAPTGTFPRCTNAFRVYDMVGNVHEWTRSPSGTFRGGYFLDTKINGEGCLYRTVAHAGTYHDYSTGFRCCAAPTRSPSAGSPETAPTE